MIKYLHSLVKPLMLAMSLLNVDILPKEELGENFLKKGHGPTFSQRPLSKTSDLYSNCLLNKCML